MRTPEKNPPTCLLSADRTATKAWRWQMTCVATFNVDAKSEKRRSFQELNTWVTGFLGVIDEQEGRSPLGICRNIQVSTGQGMKVSVASSLHSGQGTHLSLLHFCNKPTFCFPDDEFSIPSSLSQYMTLFSSHQGSQKLASTVIPSQNFETFPPLLPCVTFSVQCA